MPCRDKTGPFGQGPGTGLDLGGCTVGEHAKVAGYFGYGAGRDGRP